jgi:cytochrome c
MHTIFGSLFLQTIDIGKDIPLPLPLPEWLLVLLLIVGFLAHILFINLMVGGTLLCLFFEFLGIKNDDYYNLSKEIAATITVNKSLAIVLGVAPLLVINTLYTKFFYSANALTGLVWILVIPLVTIALLVLYLHKYTYDKLDKNRPLHVALLTLPAVIFLFIPLVFLTNINLMLFPDKWGVVRGFLDALTLPNVFPRYFHFFNASLTVTALFLFYWISRPSYPFADKFKQYSRYDFQKRFYSIAFACSIAQFLFGPVALFTLPDRGLGLDMVLTILTGAIVAIIPTWYLWKEITGKAEEIGRYFTRIAVLLSITVLFMGTGRHLYRANALAPHRQAMQRNTEIYMAEVAKAKNNPNLGAEEEALAEGGGASVWETKCSVCHAKDKKLVGPPVTEMQTLYASDKKGLIQWIKAPGKKRPDYPQMPGFEGQISEEDLEKLADFILEMK